MGKKRRLNRFITKWIKSDLPEDCSTVLLLGVTRIPTSPLPARRPCSLPIAPADNPPKAASAQIRRSSFNTRRQIVRRSSSVTAKRRPDAPEKWSVGPTTDENAVTPSNCDNCNETVAAAAAATTGTTTTTVMDRSVDSIGTCSLDVEASADLSDWSEASSGGTLRSASLKTPSTEPHLPSYLSLACTVNGYSTTTNYDRERLARSRDASPHRPQNENLTPKNFPTYSVQNNLLSPPNLVPLPIHVKPKMGDNTLTQQHHQEFYRATKTMTFISSKESRFTSNLFVKDTVDACYENGHVKTQQVTYLNGQSKLSETSSMKEFSNGTETKSFIQQRVERLYGPGALAQGFFVMKRQKNSESDQGASFEKSHQSLSNGDGAMKQSTSTPTLPVLRHLRPEFRAQLPIISPRKGENMMQKSNTLPTLKDEVNINGNSKKLQTAASEGGGIAQSMIAEESGEKDGHYFLKILQCETDRLLKQADITEAELLNEGLSEEVIGKIRSAFGKARLLVSQKMQQFRGLCTNNITQVEGEAFPTTNEDLQGFWDMVMLQVDQVDAIFKEIETLKANDWKEVVVEASQKSQTNGKPKKIVAKARPTSAASEEARKQREAQRKKMIEERRKAMKAQTKPLESIEIFVPESS